jgi:hypothetical protein
MKKILLFIGCIVAICLKAEAQNYAFTQGARAAALGGSGVTLSGAQAIFNNSAGLTALASPTVIAAVQNSFFLSELKSAALGVILPTKHGVFGLKFDAHGFNTYHEELYTFIYARKLTAKVALSTDIGYFRLNVAAADFKNGISFQVGCLAEILKALRVGCQVENPFSLVTKNAILLPFKVRFGAMYMPSKAVMITTAIEKELYFPTATKVGIEYLIQEKITTRLGLEAGSIMAFTCGIGYNLSKNTTISGSLAQHPSLGSVTATEINWTFDKKNQGN